MKQTLLLLSITLAVPIAALAADRTVVNRAGTCTASVPADWTIGVVSSMAQTADNKNNIIISSPLHTDSLASLKETAQKLYTGDKVTKDTATEFEMEGKSMDGKPNVYRAVSSGKTICIGEVIFQSIPIADARRIAETLRVK